MADIDWRRWYDLARKEVEHQRQMKEQYRRIVRLWERWFFLITLTLAVAFALLAWAGGR